MKEVLNVQQIVLQHLILLCILKSFNLLPVRMMNEALRLVEFLMTNTQLILKFVLT